MKLREYLIKKADKQIDYLQRVRNIAKVASSKDSCMME